MKLQVYPPLQDGTPERTMDESPRSNKLLTTPASETEQRLWYLKHCNLISHLPPDEIAGLESISRVRRFAKGEPVYLPSEVADAVFLIARGLVKICHITPEGKTSTLALIGTGELFGELALFDGGTRGEYVEALEPTTVIRIPSIALIQLMNRHPELAMGISKVVGHRRQRIERRLGHLLFTPNRQRLAHLLLDLAEQFGVATDEGIRLNLKLSHQDIANIIGTTRETVTILLGKMKSEGLVDGRRQRVVLTNIHKLAKSVGRAPH